MNTNITIKQRVSTYLLSLHSTQSELGRKLNISRQHISRLTQGEASVGLETLLNLRKLEPKPSLMWLIEGGGEMLEQNISMVAESNAKYSKTGPEGTYDELLEKYKQAIKDKELLSKIIETKLIEKKS